jgi:precorrin-6B methylase 2
MRIPEGQTPEEIADLIKDIIQDKVVCDIGCGGGSFMVALSKYAKEVKGVEEEEEWAQIAANKGFTVQAENAFSFPLPEADVYYCWSKSAMGIYLKAKFENTKGVFIFGHTVRPSLLKLIESIPVEVRGEDFKVYITNL